ncbi:MAG: transposase family protein [Janthinobacterium lividum]
MSRSLLPLTPAALHVVQILPAPDRVTILTTPKPSGGACPLCGAASSRVHSHYTRTLADLPWQGRAVTVQVRARRFRCATAGCLRRAPARGGTIMGAPDGPPRRHPASHRSRVRWRARVVSSRPLLDAGKRRHAAAPGSGHRAGAAAFAAGGRHRRLDVATRPALRHHRLRLRARASDRPAA